MKTTVLKLPANLWLFLDLMYFFTWLSKWGFSGLLNMHNGHVTFMTLAQSLNHTSQLMGTCKLYVDTVQSIEFSDLYFTHEWLVVVKIVEKTMLIAALSKGIVFCQKGITFRKWSISCIFFRVSKWNWKITICFFIVCPDFQSFLNPNNLVSETWK